MSFAVSSKAEKRHKKQDTQEKIKLTFSHIERHFQRSLTKGLETPKRASLARTCPGFVDFVGLNLLNSKNQV